MKRPLTDTISLQELQGMRSSGLSNREIADRLDVSYATICRYLGAGPSWTRAAYGSLKTKATDVEKPVEKPPVLKCVSKIATYEGDVMRYTVMPDAGLVTLSIKATGNELVTANKEVLEKHITELLDILTMISPNRKEENQ